MNAKARKRSSARGQNAGCDIPANHRLTHILASAGVIALNDTKSRYLFTWRFSPNQRLTGSGGKNTL